MPDPGSHAEQGYSERHPHEPEIPPVLDEEGRCRICGLLVALEAAERERADAERERDEAKQEVLRVAADRDVAEATLGAAEAALARATEALEKIRDSMAGKTYNEVDSTTVAALANEALAAVSSQPAGVWLSHADAETVRAGLRPPLSVAYKTMTDDELAWDVKRREALALLGGKGQA